MFKHDDVSASNYTFACLRNIVHVNKTHKKSELLEVVEHDKDIAR